MKKIVLTEQGVRDLLVMLSASTRDWDRSLFFKESYFLDLREQILNSQGSNPKKIVTDDDIIRAKGELIDIAQNLEIGSKEKKNIISLIESISYYETRKLVQDYGFNFVDKKLMGSQKKKNIDAAIALVAIITVIGIIYLSYQVLLSPKSDSQIESERSDMLRYKACKDAGDFGDRMDCDENLKRRGVN